LRASNCTAVLAPISPIMAMSLPNTPNVAPSFDAAP